MCCAGSWPPPRCRELIVSRGCPRTARPHDEQQFEQGVGAWGGVVVMRSLSLDRCPRTRPLLVPRCASATSDRPAASGETPSESPLSGRLPTPPLSPLPPPLPLPLPLPVPPLVPLGFILSFKPIERLGAGGGLFSSIAAVMRARRLAWPKDLARALWSSSTPTCASKSRATDRRAEAPREREEVAEEDAPSFFGPIPAQILDFRRLSVETWSRSDGRYAKCVLVRGIMPRVVKTVAMGCHMTCTYESICLLWAWTRE